MTKWGLEWGNLVTSLDWDYKFAPNHETSLKAYYTMYDSMFGLNDEGRTIIKDHNDYSLVIIDGLVSYELFIFSHCSSPPLRKGDTQQSVWGLPASYRGSRQSIFPYP